MIKIDNLTEMLKGILEGLVLEIVGQGETYGYEIVKRLNALGFENIVEATVYTILVRLERNKLVDIQKMPSEVGPTRKCYSLNKAGQENLQQFWDRWDFVSTKVLKLKESRYV